MTRKLLSAAFLSTVALSFTAGGCGETAKVEDLVQGSAPELPAALSGVELGASASDLDAKIPEQNGVRVLTAGALRYEAQLDRAEAHLDAIEVSLPKELSIDALAESKWGAPLKGKSMGTEYLTWANDETGLLVRAWSPYETQRVKFSRHVAIAKMLSKSGKGFGFEAPRTILGSSKEELKAAYPSYEDAGASYARLRLDKTVCADIFTTVTITFGQFGQTGKATGIELKIEDDVCETPPDSLKKALATFGTGEPDEKDENMTIYSKDPMVALAKTKDGWTVAVVGIVKDGA